MHKITCHHCGKEIEITDALSHQIEEETLAIARAEAEKKALQSFEFEKQKLLSERDEDRENTRKLQSEILQLTKMLNDAERKRESQAVELEKRLMEKENQIRREERERASDEERLKLLEREKTINDLQKALSEAQKKASQGSQQTQGEVLELDIEQSLKTEFPQDDIVEVPKGIRGADVIQIVKDKFGRSCGSIIWETKNAKWSAGWVDKLKIDQRAAKADIAVLATRELPVDIKQFALKNNVWVVDIKSAIALASALRFQLYQIYVTKQSAENKNERVEALFTYFTSSEFIGKIEGIMESFTAMRKDIETERRWFALKWERQEKTIRRALDNTAGLYGSLQGVTDGALPPITSLELSEGEA